MQTDMRDSAAYREAEALYESWRRPGTGQITDAADIHVARDGREAVFAGTLVDRLEGTPPTRICRVDLETGRIQVVTFGPNTDRLPKFSPDGRQIAFLSDRRRAGDFQLHLLDSLTGAARATPPVEGWVEYLHWSPDGQRILLGVAGHGADVAGGQGAVTSRPLASSQPSWAPSVDTGDESFRWRRAWIYEVATDRVQQVSDDRENIWEAAWCGNQAIVAVTSATPSEGSWYAARLHLIDVRNGASRLLYEPEDQLGWPAASPSGRCVAVVEAVCSDRWIVAGELRLIDTASARVVRIDTRGVDVTHAEWRSENRLLLAGHRGFERVVGIYDVDGGTFVEHWASDTIGAAWPYLVVSGIGERGDCALIGEEFTTAPQIALLRDGQYRAIVSLCPQFGDDTQAIAAIERVTWSAADGLEIQGWLLKPHGAGPYALVMMVHGGPVSQWRPTWLGRSRGVPILMLVSRGYAVFLPNPRGSSGRGRDFARHVLGDMGGADAHDCLSGIDHLVGRGLADPQRLGVTGISYGGFMTAWLITMDQRFKAAVPVAPMTNYVTEHLISNIPHFCALFLRDSFANPSGQYFQRSPVMFAGRVKTPTLNICGALDRCTPPVEAMQFHAALLENGIESVLVTYPEEGHGIRKLPASIDYAARVISWFERHMPAR